MTSLKLFMAYKGALMVDDATLFRAMQQAAANDLLIMVHAENGDAIDILVQRGSRGRATSTPKYHALTRPPELEAEATYRAIRLAEVAGAPLYVVHLTNEGALEAVRRRACPRQARSMPRPASSISFSPRTTWRGRASRAPSGSARRRSARSSDQEALWRGVADNSLQVISTDHCPFWFEGGKDGRTPGKELGRENFAAIPNGCPGIEDRMMVLYTARRARRQDLDSTAGSSCAAPIRPSCSACIRRRARSRPVATPIS